MSLHGNRFGEQMYRGIIEKNASKEEEMHKEKSWK